MRTLIAFSLLVAAVVAEPQYFYSGYSAGVHPYTSSYPYVSGVYPYSSPVVSPVLSKSVYPVAHVTYPAQDTSRGLPQPVQDTPEVQYAKAVFAKQYEQAAVRSAVGAVPVVHSIHKRQAVFPYAVPVKTPASTTLTSPLVYSAAPVVSSYSAYPYSTYSAYPYSYGAYHY